MKQILSLLLALALCAGLSVPALAAGFTDVPPGHYAVGAIDGCVAKGIVSGYADGSFKPDNPVTNAQFCVMAARAFYPELTAQNQGEVSKGWYMPYVRALWLTNAIEETAFSSYADFPSRADRFITRYDMAQMAKQILYRHRTKATDEQMAAAQANIGDWGAIPENYRKAVSTCYALGILGGQKDGTFGGDRYMNRAQGCVVIGRLDQLLGGAKPFMSSDQAASEAAVRPAAPPIQQSSAPQPSTFQTPVHPAADPAQFPEIRCLTCGYLMRQAGSPEMDYNNGGANGAMFHSCELCNAAYICNQCSKNMEDAAFNMRRHEAVCASGGDMIPIADFCSPYYRDSVYHQRLKSVTLTGDYRRDILAVAASQIGYMEGDNETQLDGSYGGRGDHSEYSWFLSGDSSGAWCSEFASWCARQAEIPSSILHTSYGACPDTFGGTAYAWSDTVFAGGGYMPQPGDLMLVCHSNRAVSTADAMDHTTIMESVSWNGDTVTVTVIEGNADSTVRRYDYIYNASRGFCGYFVAPDYP